MDGELERVGKRDTWTRTMKRIYSRSLQLLSPPFEPKLPTNPPEASEDDEIIKQGWLLKKGKMRWVVIRKTPPYLVWFKNNRVSSLHLIQNKIDDLSEYQIDHEFCKPYPVLKLSVSTNSSKKTYNMFARDEIELVEWLEAVRKSRNYCNMINKSNFAKFFKMVPIEVIKHLFSFMDQSDIANLSMTCKDIYERITASPLVQAQLKKLRKWRILLEKGREYAQKNPHEIQKRIRKGVPSAIRRRMWIIFTEAHQILNTEPNLYQRLLKQELSPDIKEKIKCDICRTFPTHPFFAKSFGQQKLESVLHALAIYHDSVEYVQGCNFLAGVLLLALDEQDTFAVLLQLMNKYNFQHIFNEGFPGLQKTFWIFEKFMQQYLPDLFQHFIDENIQTPMYATQWFMCAFACSLQLKVVIRIWDLFLFRGWVAIHRIAIAILKIFKDILMRSNFEEIMGFFSDLQEKITDADAIFEAAFSISMSNSTYLAYKQEYELQNLFLRK